MPETPAATEPELPRGVALAWGIAANPQRGPKRELSIERIVEAAIELADAEGLAAVSMSRVAAALGFTPMSLYRYVTSKDDLVLLMQEAASDVPVPEADPSRGWRDGLTQLVLTLAAAHREHPWLLDIPISGAPITPNSLAVVDWFLREVRDLPLQEGEKIATLLLLTSYTRAWLMQERDIALATASDEGSAAGLARALSELVTPERFPWFEPMFRSGAYLAEDDGDEDDFGFGLARILDGIERYVAAQPRAAGPAGIGSLPDNGEFDDRSIQPLPRDSRVREANRERRAAERAVREAERALREAERKLRDAGRKERDEIRRARGN